MVSHDYPALKHHIGIAAHLCWDSPSVWPTNSARNNGSASFHNPLHPNKQNKRDEGAGPGTLVISSPGSRERYLTTLLLLLHCTRLTPYAGSCVTLRIESLQAVLALSQLINLVLTRCMILTLQERVTSLLGLTSTWLSTQCTMFWHAALPSASTIKRPYPPWSVLLSAWLLQALRTPSLTLRAGSVSFGFYLLISLPLSALLRVSICLCSSIRGIITMILRTVVRWSLTPPTSYTARFSSRTLTRRLRRLCRSWQLWISTPSFRHPEQLEDRNC